MNAVLASVFASALLKFEVFTSLYHLNMLMHQADTLHVGRYWFEGFCCNITDQPTTSIGQA